MISVSLSPCIFVICTLSMDSPARDCISLAWIPEFELALTQKRLAAVVVSGLIQEKAAWRFRHIEYRHRDCLSPIYLPKHVLYKGVKSEERSQVPACSGRSI